jgi:hypothetical protein
MIISRPSGNAIGMCQNENFVQVLYKNQQLAVIHEPPAAASKSNGLGLGFSNGNNSNSAWL